MKRPRPPQASRCPECGEPVRCGARLGEERCWCAELPAVQPQVGDGPPACLCERCLRRRIEDAETAEPGS